MYMSAFLQDYVQGTFSGMCSQNNSSPYSNLCVSLALSVIRNLHETVPAFSEIKF